MDLSREWQRMLKFVVCADELPYCRHLTRQGLGLFTLMSSPYLPDILVADHGVNRGEKRFIKLPNDIFTWSIAIAFSKQRICGLMTTKETFTADKMKDFYYELFYSKIKIFKEDNELLVLVCDNSVTHKSEKIKRFIQDSRVSIITWTPYSPCLNPTEHMIGAIKSKVRSNVFWEVRIINLTFCRLLSLSLIRQTIESIPTSILPKFIKASHIETIQKNSKFVVMIHLFKKKFKS